MLSKDKHQNNSLAFNNWYKQITATLLKMED